MPSIQTQSSPQRPSRYSIYKRIGNLMLVTFAAMICVNVWLLTSDISKRWYDQQANQLGKSLSAYAAKVIAPALREDDIEAISTQLLVLSNDPHVQGVSVFNHRGRIIDSTERDASVLANFLLDDTPPLVFVEEIREQDIILGYLRILLDKQQIMRFHDDYQLRFYEQTLVLIMLAGLAGVIVARSFYKFRFRRHVKPNK